MTFLSITAAALLLLSSDPVSSEAQFDDDQPGEVLPFDDVSGETDLSDAAPADLDDAAAASPSIAAAEQDPIAAAASGLIAQIEDDNNPGGDLQLVSMNTNGCTTTITASGNSGTGEDTNAETDAMSEAPAAKARTWTIDWAVPGSLAPADTFIFIDVAPVKIAIVGDASKPDQAAKLDALFAAMFETQLDCSTQF